jgi:hypothetical protein
MIESGVAKIGDFLIQNEVLEVSPFKNLSPLGRKHIKLTGDYVWRANTRFELCTFRQLQLFPGS